MAVSLVLRRLRADPAYVAKATSAEWAALRRASVVAEVQKTFGRSYDRIYRRSGPRFYTP